MGKHGITRRYFQTTALGLAAGAALGSPALRTARAQAAYPSRPVRLVLPFAAGGVADITSRLAAEKLGEKLGQRFVVENTPGPGGIAAARAVLSAAPDGYTLGLVTNGTSISAAIYNTLPFDPKDFVCVSSLGFFDLVFGMNTESQYRTLPDFIKAAREQPGKLNVGTINVGSTQNLGAELFKSTAGLDFQIVPYRGTPEIIIALLRGDVQLIVDFYAAMKGNLVDGKIRAAGTSGTTRVSYMANVPTVAESTPGYEVASWNGVFAPKGTPADVVAMLNKAMHEILTIPEVKSKYAEFGVEAKASTGAELRSRLEGDITKWAAVIEKAKIPKL